MFYSCEHIVTLWLDLIDWFTVHLILPFHTQVPPTLVLNHRCLLTSISAAKN